MDEKEPRNQPAKKGSLPAGELGGADLTIGEILRQARKRKNISLHDISIETRISLPMLEALEKDHFDEIGSEAYVKGFLRSYAMAVDLDPQKLLTRYALQSGTTHKSRDDLWEVEGPVVERVRGPRLANRLLIRAVLIAIAVLLLIIVLRGRGGDESESGSGPRPQPRDMSVSREPATPVSDPARDAASLTPSRGEDAALGGVVADTSERKEFAEFSPRDLGAEERAIAEETEPAFPEHEAVLPHLVLTATAYETTWVQLSIDGGDIQEYLFVSPDETMRWEAAEFFTITLGNAGGLRLQLNEKDLGFLGKSGEIVREVRIDSTSTGE